MLSAASEASLSRLRNGQIGYNIGMRLRLGFVLGFSSGYYLGARAGRARYEQLNRLFDKARRSDAYETATEKTKTLVDDGVERAKDFVEEHRGGNGEHAYEPAGDDQVSEPSPGPPAAGSLYGDRPPGGPPPP